MATISRSQNLLKKLSIEDVNPGACYGPDGWITDSQGSRMISYNPATGDPIAAVVQSGPETYERVVAEAARAFDAWRMTPAPKRGDVVRDLGERAAGDERTAGRPRQPRNGQDPRGRTRRSAGNDRYLRLRGRIVAPALRPDDGLGAPRASHDGAMASAGRHRRDHGIQLSCRRVVLEQRDRRGVRRSGGLEAGRTDPAVRDCRAAHRQPGDGGSQPARHL